MRTAPTIIATCRHRGGGLIDVLVAMGVLSGAVAGLAQLQALAFRECADARLRNTATLLARAKLDDLRAHSQLDAGAPGTFGYDEIGSDRGGTEDAEGRLHLPAGSVDVDGTRFDRRWTATALHLCGAEAAPSPAPCAGGTPSTRPPLLALGVVITWTDRQGQTRRVVLEGTAVALEPLAGAVPPASTPPT